MEETYTLTIVIKRPAGSFHMHVKAVYGNHHDTMEITMAATTPKGGLFRATSDIIRINRHEVAAVINSSIYVMEEWGRKVER